MDLAEELYRFNPWWETSYVPEFILRSRYMEILQKNLFNRDVLLITGLRRVGKTSLMKSFIGRLLQEIDPQHILYVSLDSLSLEPFTISEILRAYRKLFRLSLDTKVYLFFDEVAYRPHVHQELKNLYDREKVKIFASSSSASILRDTQAFLTGRARVVEVLPLDFEEFLDFKGWKPKVAESYLLESYFEQYMKMGGMPEYVLSGDVSYLDNLIDGVLYKDIVAFYRVRDLHLIKELFRLLMERAGKQVSINKMARVLEVSPDTIKRYVEYFRETFLIYAIERCGKLNERMKAPKKLFAADVGIRNHLTGFRDKGAVFENLVFLKIKDRYPCYVYRDGIELDFYFDDTLVEVKYGQELTGKQKEFFERFPAGKKMLIQGVQGYRDLLR